MSTARYIVGDTREVLRTLPDASVDLALMSPPFWDLRSYLAADDPAKVLEMGSEPSPGAFLDALLDVVVELRRVLAPHGSVCVELGDTYQNKSLCLIPSSFAWALAYGRNPWTGRELEPWRVRNLIAWARPNPPVGALGDKFRPATSYMTVACVSDRRYFDLDAVRTETDRFDCGGNGGREFAGGRSGGDERGGPHSSGSNPAGAPPLDYWVIPTHPYPGSHYATFPPELCVRPIKAMCPERVCRVCGKPSERITGEPEYVLARDGGAVDARWVPGNERPSGARQRKATGGDNGAVRVTDTLGWSDCGHNDYRRGVVLDPFAGSGTTLEVATGHGRDAIGIDLDARNADLARQRVGFFLSVDEAAA